MLPKEITNDLQKFIKCMNRNSPLKNAKDNLKDYRYPYKPALIIALFTTANNPIEIFKEGINLSDIENPIFRVYYDLITNSAIFFEYLCNQNSKEEWRYGYKNEITKRLVQKNIFDNPAKHLVENDSTFWIFDKHKSSVKIQVSTKTLDDQQYNEIAKKLLHAAYKRITECIPEYVGYSLHELLAYYDTFKLHTIETLKTIQSNTTTPNKFQQQRDYIYAKLVKERDNKCLICCSQNPSIIQACHIKPFARSAAHEQIDIDNGVTLCANHHILFDRGYFSFDDQWKVIISPHWNERDFDLLIKTFESCYQFSCQNLAVPNVYLNYHRKNIFLY